MFLQMDAFFDRFYSYKSSSFLKNLFLINTCPLDVRVSSCSTCKVSLGGEHSGAIRILSKRSEVLSEYYPRAMWIQSGDIQTLDSKAAKEADVIRRYPRLLFLCRDLLSYSSLFCDLDLIQTTSSLNPSL